MRKIKQVLPWMFGVTSIPYGVVGFFSSFVLPVILRASGLSVDGIGWFSIAMVIPVFTQFLYSPVIDFFFNRKTWLILCYFVCAGCLILALFLPLPQKAGWFLILVVIAQFSAMILGACNGRLMATLMKLEQYPSASGWHNFGNLSGGALTAGLISYFMTFWAGNL